MSADQPQTITRFDSQQLREDHLQVVEDETASGDLINVTLAIPDGGYGWVITGCCSLLTFTMNGLTGSWGVIQAALLRNELKAEMASTTAWIGSLQLASSVALGVLSISLLPILGARRLALLGVLLLSIGEFISSYTIYHVEGLFCTVGMVSGIGCSIIFALCNSMPAQYFSGKLGLANGIVKAGGGIGATVMSVAIEKMIARVGTAWMFRILGMLTLATATPAAWMVKERMPMHKVASTELNMFRNVAFSATFVTGAAATFALFIPPFFLPSFAESIGLTPATGAGLVAGFNLCGAVGRLLAGPAADSVGPLNMLFLTLLVNALTMLAIWPISKSLGPLVLFSILNGLSNGSFFTVMPTVAAKIFGPGRAAAAMSMSVTGWTGGYLLGPPIAGYLLQASGISSATSANAYRPAVFYAGSMVFVASIVALFSRLWVDIKVLKRL